MYKVTMPLAIVWGKGKTTKFTFNLNYYRNAHHHLVSRAKREYHSMAYDKIFKARIPKLKGQIKVTYVFYARNKGRVDLGNVCSIHDKFFMDALVLSGVIKDDSFYYVPLIEYRFGGIDPIKPRMEIFIEEIEDMKNELVIECATHVEVVGDKTTIYLSEGGKVVLKNGAELIDEEKDKVVPATPVKEQPKEEAPKPVAKKKAQPKQTAVAAEEPVPEPTITDEQVDSVLLEEEDEISINQVFSNAVESEKPAKPNPFAKGSVQAAEPEDNNKVEDQFNF